MLNPATAAVGVLMGRKAVKDERERRLTMERQQAKITARQFIDDAGFEVGKEMKDAMRLLHRQLRDHYQEPVGGAEPVDRHRHGREPRRR